MDIIKHQTRNLKFAVFGVLFLLYNISLVRQIFWLRNFAAPAFLILAGAIILNHASQVTKEEKKIHFLLLGIIINWIFRNLQLLFDQSNFLIGIFSPGAFVHLTFSFLTTCYIFIHFAKQLNKSELILDVFLIQSVMVAIGVSVRYFPEWSYKLPLWVNATQYAYRFFELMTVVLIMVIFTAFHKRRLCKHYVFILLALLSFICLRSFYYYSLVIANPTYLLIAEFLYLIPTILVLIGMDRWRIEVPDILFDQTFVENHSVSGSGKSYLVIFLGVLSLILYMQKWITHSVMIFIIAMLITYHIINNTIKAERKLRDAERKREQLEFEVDRRTKELRQRNEELKEKNGLLGDLIYFDMNLGLYTIRYLQENLPDWNAERPLTLIVIDIKDFKNINSQFSYAVGDAVLSTVSSRLKMIYSRDTFLFRLNSNKFGILFLKELNKNQIEQVADEIYRMEQTPIKIGEMNIRVKFSIGIACYEKGSEDIQKILESAEYAEREAHRMIEEHAYQIFDREIERKIEREKAIRRLLEDIDFNEEFELHYQPQCDVNGNLLGMEALLRWTSPELGKISPGEFIPIAEQSTVILRIAQWTLRKGIEQIKIWNTKYKSNYRAGINISTKFIENASFLKYVQDVIAEFEIPARWLDLEVTETSLMNMNKDIIRLFEELSELGVSISIDDFGTGYSSLSYINSFQISNIKIARELVESIVTNPKESALVKAIIMMANSLELDIVAEGVEEKSQLQTLAFLGCEKIQGYYFGRPQSASDFEKSFIQVIKLDPEKIAL